MTTTALTIAESMRTIPAVAGAIGAGSGEVDPARVDCSSTAEAALASLAFKASCATASHNGGWPHHPSRTYTQALITSTKMTKMEFLQGYSSLVAYEQVCMHAQSR